MVWLGIEILKSSLAITKLIVDPRLPISPRLVKVPCGQATDLGRAIYANSITATPGTVTINVWEDHMLVHAIDAASADGLANGEMERRVRAVEEGGS
jgi:multicomponent Na+:H+ antiporter subunit E